MVTINSTWYRPPSLNTRLSDDEIRSRESDYQAWWEEKWGKLWRDRPTHYLPPSDMPRDTIIKPLKVIGVKDNMPVTINSTTPAVYCDAPGGPDLENRNFKTCAPSLYVVSHGGNRLDSFLYLRNAKKFAESYLVQP